MGEVASALEDAIIRALTVDNCGEALFGAGRAGLWRAEGAARALAAARFEAVAATAGFLLLDEDHLAALLDDDHLAVAREERAFEAVVAWMRAGAAAGAGSLRSPELLRRVRFGVMRQEYLLVRVPELLPGADAAFVDPLVLEALRARAAMQAPVPAAPTRARACTHTHVILRRRRASPLACLLYPLQPRATARKARGARLRGRRAGRNRRVRCPSFRRAAAPSSCASSAPRPSCPARRRRRRRQTRRWETPPPSTADTCAAASRRERRRPDHRTGLGRGGLGACARVRGPRWRRLVWRA